MRQPLYETEFMLLDPARILYVYIQARDILKKAQTLFHQTPHILLPFINFAIHPLKYILHRIDKLTNSNPAVTRLGPKARKAHRPKTDKGRQKIVLERYSSARGVACRVRMLGKALGSRVLEVSPSCLK